MHPRLTGTACRHVSGFFSTGQYIRRINKPGLTAGKVADILVRGHEYGAIKTAMDIWLNFQQLGYVLAPFGVAFRTQGSEFNSNTDREFFRNDELIVSHMKGVVNNVVELMPLDIESEQKGKLVPVLE